MMPGRQIHFAVCIAASIICGDPILFKENSSEFKPVAESRAHINKSATRRFCVHGNDPILTQRLAGWCENLATAFEKYMNIKVQAPAGSFRIYLQSGNEIDVGSCRTVIENSGDKFGFSIVIVNVDCVEDLDISRCIVRQMLNFLIYERMPEDALKSLMKKPAKAVLPAPAPQWITEGVIGNILPGVSSQAAIDVIPRWKRGELADIDDLIAAKDSREKNGQASGVADPAAVTLLLDWIRDWDKGGAIPGKLLSLYAVNDAVTADDIMKLNSSYKGRADMSSRWDKYLFGRSRSVLAPGRLALESLESFENQLVLHPGTTGIPADIDTGKAELLLDDVIALKKQDWVGDFARGKRVALFIVSAGRGDEMKSLATAYGEFLDALADRASDRKLKKLLAAARKEHERVTAMLNPVREVEE